VTLAQTQVTVSLADIGKAIRPESVSTAADDLKRQCHAFLDSLLKQDQDALRSVLDELPLSSIEGEIARAFQRSSVRQLNARRQPLALSQQGPRPSPHERFLRRLLLEIALEGRRHLLWISKFLAYPKRF
jgi:hypothetical protein